MLLIAHMVTAIFLAIARDTVLAEVQILADSLKQ